MTINPILLYFLIGFSAAAVLIILIIALVRRKPGTDPGADSLEEIRTELQKLNNIFTVPHIRGGVGETLLEELLHNWLADGMYKRQYSFRNGERADAVIFIGDFLIAVDAKFPLEGIRRAFESGNTADFPAADVRKNILKHVGDIQEKYIRPEEGTLQFALMYIPSEKIYYHLFIDPQSNLYEEALRRGVVPVSPSSIFLYIQTVVYGLRGLSFQNGEKDFAAAVYQVQKDLHEYIKIHNVLGTHVKNLIKSYEEGIRKLSRLEHSMELLENSGEKHI